MRADRKLARAVSYALENRTRSIVKLGSAPRRYSVIVNATHPFEQAGFRAPYTFVRACERVHRIPGGALSGADAFRPGGTCDVCGTAFRYGATFRDRDGVEFTTGCDCAVKALHDVDPAAAEAARNAKRTILAMNRSAERIAARETAKREREEAERLEAESFASCDVDALAVIAHPLGWARDKGLSFADAVRYWSERGNFRRATELAHEGHAMLASGEYEPVRVLPTFDAATSKHVGTIGKRIAFEGIVLARVAFEGAYGISYIVKIATDAGDLVAWKTSNPWAIAADENAEVVVGTRVRFKATIKEHGHDSYNGGCPVTWVARAKAI